jgi:hypothetical protein
MKSQFNYSFQQPKMATTDTLTRDLEKLSLSTSSPKVESSGESSSKDKRCITSIDQIKTHIKIKDFSMSSCFTKVAEVKIDNELNSKGTKARLTDIKFSPCIDIEEWKEHAEWIYIITCDEYIIKIGGTRTGLHGRTGSYLCGRPEYRKNGTCSTTNYTVYQSILNLLIAGHEVAMYAKKLKRYSIKAEEFDMTFEVPVQVFHAFETKVLEAYKKQQGKYPFLSNNKDKRFIEKQ